SAGHSGDPAVPPAADGRACRHSAQRVRLPRLPVSRRGTLRGRTGNSGGSYRVRKRADQARPPRRPAARSRARIRRLPAAGTRQRGSVAGRLPRRAGRRGHLGRLKLLDCRGAPVWAPFRTGRPLLKSLHKVLKMALRETPAAAQGTLELGMAGNGSFRWAVADITEVMEEVRDRFDLWPVPAAALGRCLAGAALLQRLATKTPSRLMLEVRGDGPLLRILAEADDEGNLRGIVGDGRVQVPDWPNGKLGVGRAVGKGYLRVLREYERGNSYQSQVELVSGEIGEDVAFYLSQSEQTRSAVLLGVLGKPSGVAAAGGMVVEVLPGAAE